MNVLRFSPSEIQKVAKLCQVQRRLEGATGRRSLLRSIELASDSPGRRSEPEMQALAMTRLMRVIVTKTCRSKGGAGRRRSVGKGIRKAIEGSREVRKVGNYVESGGARLGYMYQASSVAFQCVCFTAKIETKRES